MTKFLFDIRVWLIVAATAFFAGCINDDAMCDDPNGDEDAPVGLYIRFRMNLNVDKAPGTPRSASARADGAAPDVLTSGTSKENAVNTVGLLVYDAETDRLIDVVFLTEAQVNQLNSISGSTDDGVCVAVFAEMGQKVRIYAAVNMPDRMRNRFIIGSGRDISVPSVPPASDQGVYQSEYWTVVNEFVPGSDGKQSTLQTLEKGGIPMTGQFRFGTDASGMTDEITITGQHTTEETALAAVADVSRLVAKIHVLAQPADAFAPDTEPYVVANIVKDGSTLGRLGWIRLGNVHYMPNGVNRSTYILPQANTSTQPKSKFMDLNMDLESCLSGNKFVNWSSDYVYLEGPELNAANANSVMEVAEIYEDERFNATSSSGENRYFKGMYCPENYFDIPANKGPFEKAEIAIPMVTTVSISAKLTPCVLLVESDFKTAMDAFVKEFKDNTEKFRLEYQLAVVDFTDVDAAYWEGIKNKFTGLSTNHGCLEYTAADEKEARFIINSSIKMSKMWTNDPNASGASGKYSDGTFYVYDQQFDGASYEGSRYLCLTAGAVNKADGENIAVKARSVPHINGWGYYYTYIDNDGTSATKTPYTASQVTRNTYYLITVGNFGVPGGTVTSPDYIKVNTDKVEWDYAGRGDINLH